MLSWEGGSERPRRIAGLSVVAESRERQAWITVRERGVCLYVLVRGKEGGGRGVPSYSGSKASLTN